MRSSLIPFHPVSSSQVPIQKKGGGGEKKEEGGNLQLEERICNLKHEHMGMTMFVHHQHSFHGPPHTEILIIILQSLQPGCNRRIFLRLRFLGGERESRNGVQRQCLRHGHGQDRGCSVEIRSCSCSFGA